MVCNVLSKQILRRYAGDDNFLLSGSARLPKARAFNL